MASYSQVKAAIVAWVESIFDPSDPEDTKYLRAALGDVGSSPTYNTIDTGPEGLPHVVMVGSAWGPPADRTTPSGGPDPDQLDRTTIAALVRGIAWSTTLGLPCTTKGDLIGHDGLAAERLPVSGNDGWVLVEDAVSTLGLKWVSPGTMLSGATTDDLPEGITNLYYTEARVSANVHVVAAYNHSLLVAGNPHNVTPADLSLVIGTDVQAWDADLDAVAALAGTGLVARTAANTWTTRTLQAPAAGFTISDPDGVAGDPTFVLANDLAGLEGIGTTGLAVRTAADTWTTRAIAGTASEVAVADGDGVAGAPTIGLADDPILPGTGAVTLVTGTTAQRPGVPVTGMMRYNSDTGLIESYIGAAWINYSSSTHIHSADEVEINELGAATFDDLQDMQDVLGSAGTYEGFAITDGGGGTIDVGAGSGLIRAANSDYGPLYSFDYAGTAGFALTDLQVNWLYIDYSLGSPALAKTADVSTLDLNTQIVIGRAFRSGATVSIYQVGQQLQNYRTASCYKDFEVWGFQRASGLVLGETGVRNPTMTAGVLYCAHNRTTEGSIDCSGADTFDVWNSSASTAPDATGQTQYDNTQYWNGAALAGLTGTVRYGTRFFYLDVFDNLHMQYGTSNTTSLAEAETESVPVPPDYLRDFAIYLGRIVIQDGGAAAAVITSVFETAEFGSMVTSHDSLSNLDWTNSAHTGGGAVTEVAGFTAGGVAALYQVANTTTNDAVVQADAGGKIADDWFQNDLGALEALAGTGIAARTGASTWATRTLTAPAAGFTITDGDGVAGNPTFVLADDLAGLEGIATTGLASRTAASTWTTNSGTDDYVPRWDAAGTGLENGTVTNVGNDLSPAVDGTGSLGIVAARWDSAWFKSGGYIYFGDGSSYIYGIGSGAGWGDLTVYAEDDVLLKSANSSGFCTYDGTGFYVTGENGTDPYIRAYALTALGAAASYIRFQAYDTGYGVLQVYNYLAAEAAMYLSAVPSDGTSAAAVILGRHSTTTGNHRFEITWPGTGTTEHILYSNAAAGVTGVTNKLDISGNGMEFGGFVTIADYTSMGEAAAAPTGVAGWGHWWVMDDAPTTWPHFVDDLDVDHRLAYFENDLEALEELGDSGPTTGVPKRTAANTWELRQDYEGTSHPSASSDNTANYQVGSRWLNTTYGSMFVAVDVSTAAAVWKLLTNHKETRLNNSADGAAYEAISNPPGSSDLPTNPVRFDYTESDITTPYVSWDGTDFAYEINVSGKYQVKYRVVTTISTGTTRNQVYCCAAVDAGSGYAWIQRGQGFTYNRAANIGGFGTVEVTFERQFDDGDLICVRWCKIGNSDTINLVAFACEFTIELIDIDM